MKKILALLLLLLLCASACLNAFAEEDTAITFRGLPWGCSPEEAVRLLKEDLGAENIERVSVFNNHYPYAITTHGNKNAYNLPMLSCLVTVNNCMAAGYDIETIFLYFLPKISDDQQSYELSETEAALWKASYTLTFPETLSSKDVMVDDLVGKLSSIYGEAETDNVKWTKVSQGKGKYSVSCLHRVWQDEEYRIDLCAQDSTTMSLTYLQKPVLSTQQTIENIIQKEKEAELKPTENPLSPSTDGL